MDNPAPQGKPGDCDHFQPADLARLAEAHMRALALPEPEWEGRLFAYGAGGGSGPFKSVYMQVRRRGGDWVVTKIDRRKTDLTAEEAGFHAL